MSTAATPAASQLTVNQFELASHSGNTKVSYSPPQGPLIVGQPPKTPLVYSGPEGELRFGEAQITRDETAMGTFWCVVLTQNEAESITFALLLPPVIGDGSHKVSTYAVKARKSGSPVIVGALFSYEVEHLKGDAGFVRFLAQ
jgi:hypothetical protein